MRVWGREQHALVASLVAFGRRGKTKATRIGVRRVQAAKERRAAERKRRRRRRGKRNRGHRGGRVRLLRSAVVSASAFVDAVQREERGAHLVELRRVQERTDASRQRRAQPRRVEVGQRHAVHGATACGLPVKEDASVAALALCIPSSLFQCAGHREVKLQVLTCMLQRLQARLKTRSEPRCSRQLFRHAT